MNKLSKEKQNRMIAVALVAASIIAGLWFGLISTQRTTLDERRQSALKAQEKVVNAKRRVEKEKQVQTELEEVKQQLKEIEDGMASGDLYSWLIQTVNKFRVRYKVEIPQFSREQVSDVNLIPGFPYRSATFTLRGSAFYHDFGKFIADFENAFPFIRVANLELEPLGLPPTGTQANPEEQEKLSFRFDLITLIKPNT
ncbi:MAG: hypothetical protein HY043_08805 [Verrucomicrobia bacterium]|nr:hypothetical protein [Verrucomicrobiota bacterium]